MNKIKVIIYNIKYEKSSIIDITGSNNLFQFEKSIELKNEGKIDSLYGINNSTEAPRYIELELEINNKERFIENILDDLEYNTYIKEKIKRITGFIPIDYNIRILG